MAHSIQMQGDTTGADAPPAAAPEVVRPDGLPENFKTVADMAASYAELQATLTKNAQGKPDEAPGDGEGEAPKDDGEAPGEGEETPGEDAPLPPEFAEFNTEFEADGTLSEESFTKLEGMGFNRETVDQYINSMPTTDEDVSRVVKSVGGDEAMGELQGWASTNMKKEDLEAFNGAVKSRGQIDMAVRWLAAEKRAADGFEPELTVEGGAPTGVGADLYDSRQQLHADQKDDRYKKGDPAFHKYVDEKIMRSQRAKTMK